MKNKFLNKILKISILIPPTLVLGFLTSCNSGRANPYSTLLPVIPIPSIKVYTQEVKNDAPLIKPSIDTVNDKNTSFVGEGVDPSTGKLTGTSIFTDLKNNVKLEQGLQGPTGFLSENEINNIINDNNYRKKYYFNEDSSKTNSEKIFSNQFPQNNHSVNIAYEISVEKYEDMLHSSDPPISNEAKNMMNKAKESNDWSDFISKYSNQYIRGQNVERKIIVNFNFSSKNKDLLNQLKIIQQFDEGNFTFYNLDKFVNKHNNGYDFPFHIKMNYLEYPYSEKTYDLLTLHNPFDIQASFQQYAFLLVQSMRDNFINKGDWNDVNEWGPMEGIDNKTMEKYKDTYSIDNYAFTVPESYNKIIENLKLLNRYFVEEVTLEKIYNYTLNNPFSIIDNSKNLYSKYKNEVKDFYFKYKDIFKTNSTYMINLNKNHDIDALVKKASKLEAEVYNDDGIKILDLFNDLLVDTNNNPEYEKFHLVSIIKDDKGYQIIGYNNDNEIKRTLNMHISKQKFNFNYYSLKHETLLVPDYVKTSWGENSKGVNLDNSHFDEVLDSGYSFNDQKNFFYSISFNATAQKEEDDIFIPWVDTIYEGGQGNQNID